MEHETGHTGQLIITSVDASDISSVGGIRCPVAEPRGSRVTRSSGVLEFWRWITAVGLTIKPVGKLDAGNPHVQFDERGWETDRSRGTAPILDSTLMVCYLWLLATPPKRRADRVQPSFPRKVGASCSEEPAVEIL